MFLFHFQDTMAATVSKLQKVLLSTETSQKRNSNPIVQKCWNEAQTKEGFIKAMTTMFEHMVLIYTVDKISSI